MFILRKIISTLVLPLNVCLMLLISGVVVLFATQKQKIAKAMIVAAAFALLLLSVPLTANWLTGTLESQYAPVSTKEFSESNIPWIVVLGGGHNSSRPPGTQLSPSSLARVVEGVRIYRMKGGRKLILSGGAVYDPVPNAEAMFREAKAFGVSENDVILETKSRDTEEEASLLAPILKQEPFYLVTSAVHMPRAMALFLKQGMKPVASPVDYSFHSQTSPVLLRLLPNASALQQSERALREFFGILWSRVRGEE